MCMRLAAALLLLLASVAAASAQSNPPAAAPEPQVADSADRGHALFLRDGCFQCHGTVGQGGAAGPRLAPDPLPADAIQAYVRHPAGQMPPYSPRVLSNQDILDIQAYLSSVPKPPATGSLPQLTRR